MAKSLKILTREAMEIASFFVGKNKIEIKKGW